MNRILDLVKNEIVCVFRDKKNTANFYVGFVLGYDDDNLLLECLNQEGEKEGIAIIKNKDIYLIETKNEYIDEIKDKCDRPSMMDMYDHEDVLQELFNYLIVENEMVCIETNHSDQIDLRGVVKEIIDGWIRVNIYREDGNEERDGVSYCRIEDISMIDKV
ncbi:MAG: hypothetical protein K6G64_02580 [Eubacterium sp.]|nr:hypothetical protein [Eubacterium sp.]